MIVLEPTAPPGERLSTAIVDVAGIVDPPVFLVRDSVFFVR